MKRTCPVCDGRCDAIWTRDVDLVCMIGSKVVLSFRVGIKSDKIWHKDRTSSIIVVKIVVVLQRNDCCVEFEGPQTDRICLLLV